MKVKFEKMLIIGSRSYVNKAGETCAGGVLYNPETCETLPFTAKNVEVKDSLSPVSGWLDITIGKGKGGTEWTKIQYLGEK